MDRLQEMLEGAVKETTTERNREIHKAEMAEIRRTGKGPDWCLECRTIGCCFLHRQAAYADQLGEMVEALRDSLTALAKNQWGFERRRCSLCGGWNMGPNGETDRVHTRDCIVGVAIIKGEKLLRRATETQGDGHEER